MKKVLFSSLKICFSNFPTSLHKHYNTYSNKTNAKWKACYCALFWYKLVSGTTKTLRMRDCQVRVGFKKAKNGITIAWKLAKQVFINKNILIFNRFWPNLRIVSFDSKGMFCYLKKIETQIFEEKNFVSRNFKEFWNFFGRKKILHS